MNAGADRGSPLWQALREVGSRSRLATALVSLSTGEEWTYGRLLDEVERRAATLAAAGLAPGRSVVLAATNSTEFVAHAYALARLGSTIILASPRYGTSEVGAIAAQAEPDAWIVPVAPQSGYAQLDAAPAATRSRPLAEGLRLVLAPERGRACPLDGADAVVKFTSGSSGEPKGIRLTAQQLLAESRQVSSTLGLGPGDRTLAVVPLFHSYGFDLGVLASLLSGATLSIGDALALPILLRELGTGQHSVFLGVPITYRILLEGAQDLNLATVRWLLSCTAPLGPATITAFHERFGAPICQHYGSSETGALTNHLPAEVLGRPESVGRAMDGVRIRVLDAIGGDCPAGVLGEVVAESAAIARGYLRPGETSTPFREGRYHTGDLGTLDPDGFLTLRGRIDHVINAGGFKVSPLEVARVLEQHPAVREAAAYGAPGRSGEVVVHAMVTLKGPADEAALIEHCRGRLADYKVPRQIEIRDDLPRGATGKVRLPSRL